MRCWLLSAALLLAVVLEPGAAEVHDKKKHHHHNHHNHHRHHHRHNHGKHHHHKHHHHAHAAAQGKASAHGSAAANATADAKAFPHQHLNATIVVDNSSARAEKDIMLKMQAVEKELMDKAKKVKVIMAEGSLQVNAPLPHDFQEIFARSVSEAAGCDPLDVTVLRSNVSVDGTVSEVKFRAPRDVVQAVEDQASDPDSKLAVGPLCVFLVERDAAGGLGGQCGGASMPAPVGFVARQQDNVGMADLGGGAGGYRGAGSYGGAGSYSAGSKLVALHAEQSEPPEPSPPSSSGGAIDVDTAMPYGDLEPFGREDTAQELTESSIKESDEMVDQLERAEVAEEKRAVFRALTRLRGAAITSFDGIARTQTGNIDGFARSHQWREAHPLHHLAEEESDISKWAFPDVNF